MHSRTLASLSFFIHCCWCISACSSQQEACHTKGSWIEAEEENNQGLQMLQVRGQHIHAGEHAGEHTMDAFEAAHADNSMDALGEKYDKDQGSLILSAEVDHLYAQVIRKQWRHGGNCSTSDDGLGSSASLDQTGYTSIASLCCNFQMEFFIRRVISSMGLKLCQEGGLMRFIPSFSCSSSLTLAELKTRIALARLYPGKAKYPFVEVVSKNCPSLPQADGTKQADQIHKPTPLKMWDEAKKEMADSFRKEDKMMYAPRAASSLLPIADPIKIRHSYEPAASIQGAATVVRHHANGLKETLLPQYAECWDAGSDQTSRDAACEGDLKCSRNGFDNRYFGDCDWAHCCSKEVFLARYTECWDSGVDQESRDAACEGDLKCSRSGFDGREFGDCEETHCCSEADDGKPAPEESRLQELKPWDEEKKELDRYAECYDHGTDLQSRDAACKGDLKCARHGFDSRLFGDCDYAHCCSEEATKAADDALQQALEAHRLEDMNATESKPETVRDAPNEESELSDEFRRLSKDGVQKLEAKKYAYTLAVETLTEVEQAQCIGCHNRPNECYFACDEKPGYCSACDSFRGTRGACCGQTNGTRNGDDPSECQSVDIAQFKFSGYHQCVLTSKQAIYRVTDSDSEKVDRMSVFTPRKTGQASDIKFNYDEEPLCEDCVGRPNECWTTCGEKPGYCSACDSLWGTRGACCGINNGTRNGDDPPECHVDTDHFKYDAYHQCVLTSSKAGRQAQWKTNRTITFITVYDPYFETNLGQSALWLHRHELPHQWMLINNSKKIPISKLYARAQAKVANDLQIFVHPDVFLPNNFYDMFVYKLKLIEDIDPNWGVLGTAGIAGSIRGPLVSSITDPTTGTWRSGIDSKEITALDEQLLVLRRGSPQFDPDLPGFDLYGMDIVMQAKSLGQHSYLLNVQENHKLMAPDGNKYRANDFWDKIYSSEYEARVNKTAEYFEKKWCRSGNLPITGTTFYVDCEGWKWAR
mmetsp:Transcript_54192/g.99132  ORF Transcript_54192/g.99132 Transcript_54192/m.99132 type:complete len:987 (+) Transcript_54192:82-3042(+)